LSVSWLDEVESKLLETPIRRVRDREGVTIAAAVVPLYVAGGELWSLLLKRPAPSGVHAGRYGFPGGVVAGRDEDEVEVALRLAGGELGIDPDAIMFLGCLDEIAVGSELLISPVVGALPAQIPLDPRPESVEAVVRVPFSVLASPVLAEMQEVRVGGRRERSPVLHYSGHRVAGAAAEIVADLVYRLTGSSPAAVE
jgi:8-oxo-dGTP pyrophosphatase MutT (NUDIX family)